MLRSAMIKLAAERNHDEGADEADHDEVGRQREEQLVGRRRDDVFLQEVLDAVGEPLEDALRPDAVRPDARLHARPDAALDPARDAGDGQHEAEDARARRRRSMATGVDDLAGARRRSRALVAISLSRGRDLAY